MESGKELFRLSTSRGVGIHRIAASHDGRLVAAGGDDGYVRLVDVAAGKEVAKLGGHRARFHRIAFTPDDATIVSCANDLQVRTWDVKTRKPLAAFRFERAEKSPSDRGRAGYEDAYGDEPPLVVRYEQKANCIYSFALSPEGKHVAVSLGRRAALILDLATGKVVTTIDAEEGSEVFSLAYSHDGKLLAFGNTSKTSLVEVRRVADSKQMFRGEGHDWTVMHVAFSPDDAHLVTGGLDDGVRVWDLKAKKLVRNTRVRSEPSLTERADDLGFLPRGDIYYYVCDDTYKTHPVHFFALKTGKDVSPIKKKD